MPSLSAKPPKGSSAFCSRENTTLKKETEAAKREYWTPTYKDEYPPSTLLPTAIVKSGEPLVIDGLSLVIDGLSLVIDGLSLAIDDLGAGGSSDITVIYLPEQQQFWTVKSSGPPKRIN